MIRKTFSTLALAGLLAGTPLTATAGSSGPGSNGIDPSPLGSPALRLAASDVKEVPSRPADGVNATDPNRDTRMQVADDSSSTGDDDSDDSDSGGDGSTSSEGSSNSSSAGGSGDGSGGG